MKKSADNAAHDALDRAAEVFRSNGGILRTSKAIGAGIHPRTLYAMRDAGLVERLARGLYRLSGMPPLGNPDLVAVAGKVPNGVICLVSALAYHEITDEIPHEVHLALARGAEPPRMEHPPVRIFWFKGRAFSQGIEEHMVDNTRVRIYSAEKTIADCFKYRNRIGTDVAVGALRSYFSRGRPRLDEVMKFARICRVANVLRPYMEALL